MTHGATLGGHVVQHAVARAGIDPAEVEDVIMGCATPEGATGSNIARQIALRAGLPVTVAGVTVNRFCSSGLQTIAMAAQRVIVDKVPVMVAGGVESISCVQNEANRHMIDGGLARRSTSPRSTGDAADRRDRRQALQHRPRAQDQLRRAQPAARRRRPGRGQVQRRDRADHRHDEGRRRQGHRPAHEGSDGRRRRGHPRRHHLRGRRARSSRPSPAA
jgi:hypothetical protein